MRYAFLTKWHPQQFDPWKLQTFLRSSQDHHWWRLSSKIYVRDKKSARKFKIIFLRGLIIFHLSSSNENSWIHISFFTAKNLNKKRRISSSHFVKLFSSAVRASAMSQFVFTARWTFNHCRSHQFIMSSSLSLACLWVSSLLNSHFYSSSSNLKSFSFCKRGSISSFFADS